ncbi:MAG: class I SAM-dependent methyltransferase [Gemmataceae bacterium]|nr:class I SAM-dependent methyltransferase [Gemmataceae bacterium]
MASALPAISERPAVCWEEPACVLCESTERDTVLEAPDAAGAHLWFAVVRCRDCGTHYTCPRPDGKSTLGFYPPGYGPHQPRSSRPPRSARLARLRGRPCPERRSLPVVTGTRLLDVGCGSGDFLERMQRQGWNVTGVDASPAAVAVARARLDAPIHEGRFPNASLDGRKFDAITFWQSLEHMHDPLTALKAARDWLAPGGRVYISVPNFAGWSAKRFGAAWYGLDLPRHLTHFTPITLEAMMRKAGLDIVKTRGLAHADWVRASAARNPTTLGNRLLTRKPIARMAAWWAYLSGRSECLFSVGTIRTATGSPSPPRGQ